MITTFLTGIDKVLARVSDGTLTTLLLVAAALIVYAAFKLPKSGKGLLLAYVVLP